MVALWIVIVPILVAVAAVGAGSTWYLRKKRKKKNNNNVERDRAVELSKLGTDDVVVQVETTANTSFGILSLPYFFGGIAKSASEMMLMCSGKGNGAFLLRSEESQSDPNKEMIILSVLNNRRVEHHCVYPSLNGDGFSLQPDAKRVGKTIPKLISALQSSVVPPLSNVLKTAVVRKGQVLQPGGKAPQQEVQIQVPAIVTDDIHEEPSYELFKTPCARDDVTGRSSDSPYNLFKDPSPVSLANSNRTSMAGSPVSLLAYASDTGDGHQSSLSSDEQYVPSTSTANNQTTKQHPSTLFLPVKEEVEGVDSENTKPTSTENAGDQIHGVSTCVKRPSSLPVPNQTSRRPSSMFLPVKEKIGGNDADTSKDTYAELSVDHNIYGAAPRLPNRPSSLPALDRNVSGPASPANSSGGSPLTGKKEKKKHFWKKVHGQTSAKKDMNLNQDLKQWTSQSVRIPRRSKPQPPMRNSVLSHQYEEISRGSLSQSTPNLAALVSSSATEISSAADKHGSHHSLDTSVHNYEYVDLPGAAGPISTSIPNLSTTSGYEEMDVTEVVKNTDYQLPADAIQRKVPNYELASPNPLPSSRVDDTEYQLPIDAVQQNTYELAGSKPLPTRRDGDTEYQLPVDAIQRKAPNYELASTASLGTSQPVLTNQPSLEPSPINNLSSNLTSFPRAFSNFQPPDDPVTVNEPSRNLTSTPQKPSDYQIPSDAYEEPLRFPDYKPPAVAAGLSDGTGSMNCIELDTETYEPMSSDFPVSDLPPRNSLVVAVEEEMQGDIYNELPQSTLYGTLRKKPVPRPRSDVNSYDDDSHVYEFYDNKDDSGYSERQSSQSTSPANVYSEPKAFARRRSPLGVFVNEDTPNEPHKLSIADSRTMQLPLDHSLLDSNA